MNQEEQENNGGKGSADASLFVALYRYRHIILGAGGCFLCSLLGILLIIVIYNFVGSVAKIFMNDSPIDYGEQADKEDLKEAEREFLEKVESVADQIESKYSVSISKPLLVSTVLYSKNTGGIMSGSNEDISDEELDQIDSTEGSVDKYNVSKRELARLAKHMVDGDTAYRKYLIETYIPDNMDDLIRSQDDIEEIADEIFSLESFYRKLFYGEDDVSNGCDPFANLKVTVAGRTIPFKEYVVGVVWPESSYFSANSESYSAEYGKTQIIASKTYVLKHKYTSGATEIHVSDTTEGFQVWCDIYTAGACGSTGNPSETQISNLKERYDAVASLFRVDDNGNLINTQYASTQSVCDSSAAHSGCKEDGSSNAMNQTGAYQKAKNGMSFEQILDTYYQGHNGSFGDVSSCETNTSGNWENWKQCDSSWGSITMGSSNICNIGCLATSISMLVANSGVDTKVSGSFNPGTFITALKKNGGFTSGGGLYWDSVSKVVPDFTYGGQESICGLSKSEKVKKVKSYLDKGYYVVLEVKGRYCSGGSGEHWVAVKGTTGSDILMADPAGLNDTRDHVFEKYGDVASTIAYYKKK